MNRLAALPQGFWTTLFAVVAGIDAYLLIQTEVPLDPPAKLLLGVIAVGVAILNKPGLTSVAKPVLPQDTKVTVITPEGEPNKVVTV